MPIKCSSSSDQLVSELKAERDIWEQRVRLSDSDEDAREYANTKINDLSGAIGSLQSHTATEKS